MLCYHNSISRVVEAATIAADSLDLLIKKLSQDANSNECINKLNEEDKYSLIKQILTEEEYNFIVTPKEIDDLVRNMSSVIARGINMSIN